MYRTYGSVRGTIIEIDDPRVVTIVLRGRPIPM